MQDEELLSILEDLQHIEMPEINVCNRIQEYFFSDTVFGLSKKVLSETEMRVIAKGLDFATIQIKWHFSNDVTLQPSEIPAFTPKFKWQSPKGHPNLEVFLNQIEK